MTGWIKPDWLVQHEALPTWEKIARKLTDTGMGDRQAHDLVKRAMAEVWDESWEASDDPHPASASPNPYRSET